MACGRGSELKNVAEPYVTTIPTLGKSPRWMSLSRRASIEARGNHYDVALTLMEQSLNDAHRAGASPDVLWCLRSKTCDILLSAGRIETALSRTETFLRQLKIADWPESVIRLRLLNVKRSCLLLLGKIEEAKLVSEEMNTLDCNLLGFHSTERIKRLTRTIELDFATEQFAKIARDTKPMESDIQRLVTDTDPDSYLFFALVGLSQVLSGDDKEGLKNIARAKNIESLTEKQGLPRVVGEAIKKMDKRDEINKLLNH